ELSLHIQTAPTIHVQHKRRCRRALTPVTHVHSRDEAYESISYSLIGSKEFRMIILDRCQNNYARVIVEKVIVKLVGLVDEYGSMPQVDIASPLDHGCANFDGWIKPTGDGKAAE